MKFLEKDMTLDQRQTLDILFWMFIFLSGGSMVFFYLMKWIIFIPFIIFVISFYLMYKNNKIAMTQIKKERNDNETQQKM